MWPARCNIFAVQALCSIFACPAQHTCGPCTVYCRPRAVYLQATCNLFACPAHHICRPGAIYLQCRIGAVLLEALCNIFAGPAQYFRCIIFAGPLRCWQILCNVLEGPICTMVPGPAQCRCASSLQAKCNVSAIE